MTPSQAKAALARMLKDNGFAATLNRGPSSAPTATASVTVHLAGYQPRDKTAAAGIEDGDAKAIFSAEQLALAGWPSGGPRKGDWLTVNGQTRFVVSAVAAPPVEGEVIRYDAQVRTDRTQEHIGEFIHTVRIDAQDHTADAAGNLVATWSTVATVSAKMQGVSAEQVERGGRDEGLRRYECVMLYRSDVGTNNRIIWEGRLFDVTGVLNHDGRSQLLTLYLLERNADVDGPV